MLIFAAGAAAVIAVAVLISGLAGALVALVLLSIGAWRAVGLFQRWRREGSDPTIGPDHEAEG